MEKKSVYVAPAMRESAVFYDAGFLRSTNGRIDDWIEDEDTLDF